MANRTVVIDTNVLISAALKERSPPARLVEHVLLGHVIAMTCPSIIAEYWEVFRRPKFQRWRFPPAWLEFLITHAIALDDDPSVLDMHGPDRDDLVFLALALRQNATLVTGNIRDFPLAIRRKVQVCQPSEYLRWLEASEN